MIDNERTAIIATSLCDAAKCPGLTLCARHIAEAEEQERADRAAAEARQMDMFDHAVTGGG